jgi:transglutaminase/protease-like cytokinesis protein 3
MPFNKYTLWGIILAAFFLASCVSNPLPPPWRPIITSEELRAVEFIYTANISDIENYGKRIYIRNSSERTDFIRRYQGNPDIESVRAVRGMISIRRPYDIEIEPPEYIVAFARSERNNNFLKVKILHDWVADIFFYNYDYLEWMLNKREPNPKLSLGEILELKRGVCLEYAILFWMLADAAGLETYLILDHSKSRIGHAYNMVIIDNTGYIVDTTWDSRNEYRSGRSTPHTISKDDYFMPSISQSYRLRGW